MGRLEEIKGIEVLLKAWKYLSYDAPELYLCGKGPLEECCRNYIKENQLTKIHLMGFVPNDEVKKMIGNSKALILPTQVYEGFPMTVAESYACGTPVIGSDLGNTGSLIENGVNGLKFDHTSPKALAECVKRMELWNQEFPEYIQIKYSVEENYKKLLEIYEKQ